MKYNGIVINLAKNKVVVTTSDFQCFYIKRSPTIYVGKQIGFNEKDIIRKRPTLAKLVLGAAACIAILFVIASVSNFEGITNLKSILSEPKVFAYLDIDINPSMEVGIDERGDVLRVLPLNENAKSLIKKVKLNKKSVTQAIGVIIDEVKKNRVISDTQKDYVLVSSTLNSRKNELDKEFQTEREKLDKIVNSLKNDIQDKENGKVIVFLVQANMSERKDARSRGISTGRYVLYNKYKDSKSGFSIEEAKSITVNELLKDILNYKTEKEVVKNTPGPTHLPLMTEDNTQNGFITHNELSKDNFTKAPNEKLFTPTPSPTLLALLPLSPTPLLLPSPTPTIQNINSTFMRFESYNYRGQFIRHQSFKARISKDVTPFDDSVFNVVPGLADSNCISLESKNFPGYYLMHENFKIVLKKYDGSANFRECATFIKVPGFADKNLISFRSYNYPKRYIRHMMYYLQIDEIVSDLDKKDATFTEIKAE